MICRGQRHYGASIGTQLFPEEYVYKEVKLWSGDRYVIHRLVYLFMVYINETIICNANY